MSSYFDVINPLAANSSRIFSGYTISLRYLPSFPRVSELSSSKDAKIFIA